MYAVVEFTDEGSVAVVPRNWLAKDKKKCSWPMWTNQEKIQHAVKQCSEPTTSFMCLSVRVLYESGNIHILPFFNYGIYNILYMLLHSNSCCKIFISYNFVTQMIMRKLEKSSQGQKKHRT